MYTKIDDPILVIYDGETGDFIGDAKFSLTPMAQSQLLQVVNYGTIPSSLILLDVDLYDPSPDYVPPEPFYLYHRNGIIKGLFTESDTRTEVPIDIFVKYDVRARGNTSGSSYLFDSIELRNIEIQDIKTYDPSTSTTPSDITPSGTTPPAEEAN